MDKKGLKLKIDLKEYNISNVVTSNNIIGIGGYITSKENNKAIRIIKDFELTYLFILNDNPKSSQRISPSPRHRKN